MASTPRPSSPVVRPSVTTVLANAIAADIRARALAPGERVGTQRELAARFDVAVATLREALRQLEVLGFLSIRHGSGIFVGDGFDRTVVSSTIADRANRQRLVQLLDARRTLEPSIVEQAATIRDQRGLSWMHEALELAREHVAADGADVTGSGVSDSALWRINLDIHRAMAAAAGNPILEEVLDSLLLAHATEQREILAIHGDPQRDFSEHEHLVRLISEGRAAAARSAMSAHLSDVAAVVREIPGSTSPP